MDINKILTIFKDENKKWLFIVTLVFVMAFFVGVGFVLAIDDNVNEPACAPCDFA